MKKQKTKPFWEMNADELAKATQEFDREFVADTFRKPTPQERAKWLRAKRKPGRPRTGRGGMENRDLAETMNDLARTATKKKMVLEPSI